MKIIDPKPKVGDYIALDWGGKHPSRYAARWFCSRVIAVESNGYRVDFDDGLKVYGIARFEWPKRSRSGSMIYPAE